MTLEEHEILITEAQRLIQEAIFKGELTLQSGENLPMGSLKAQAILAVAKDIAKQRKPTQKRINIAEDFQVRATAD